MNPLKRISAFFQKPEERLRALNHELEALASGLDHLGMRLENEPDSPLREIVTFFELTSPWHDRGLGDLITAFKQVNDGQYDTVITRLCELDNQFAAAGRSPYGINRTKREEAVTEEKIFLGNTYGLFTHPVSRWKLGRDAPAGNWGFSGMEDLNPYDVVSKQARDFMTYHLAIMAERARTLATM